MTDRERDCEPGAPHVLVHAVHGSHDETAQSSGQSRNAQCDASTVALHGAPPYRGATVTLRWRCLMPSPPHVMLQAPHAFHGDISQSTGTAGTSEDESASTQRMNTPGLWFVAHAVDSLNSALSDSMGVR